MRLLEVVRGEQTSHETLATVMNISKRIKKAAVVSLNAPGFIGNRMLFNYTAQANMLLLEGALPHQIDQAIESFGLNMGPFRMMDLVGLDLGWRARKLSGAESPLHAKIGDHLCDNHRFGQKNGKGYYNYSEGSRAPNPAPENEAIYEKISSENGFTRREISDEEITDRCLLALINEGADILSEGVAQRAADIDVVYINGYGFPIWRGGPMHHANAMGLDVVVEKLKKYHEITGNNAYKPSELLIKLAKNGEKFSEAPLEEERKEKLNFAMSSVAGNF
jgi:3-hydroxyacyl-CoA dehydrogenase